MIYTSDHGDWLGDHGLIRKGPMPWEGLLRVPFLMAGPGVPAGAVVSEPISTRDIAATIYNYTATAPGHGRSLRPICESGAPRDFAMMEWELFANRVGVALSLRTVRAKDAKLTVELRSGAGEMYNLAADPHERTNLFGNLDHAVLQARLEDDLHQRPDDIGPMGHRVGPG